MVYSKFSTKVLTFFELTKFKVCQKALFVDWKQKVLILRVLSKHVRMLSNQTRKLCIRTRRLCFCRCARVVGFLFVVGAYLYI